MIRKATKEDKLEFLVLVKEFLRESKYPFSLSVKKVSENYDKVVEHPDFFVFLSVVNDEVVGFLVAGVTSPLFSEDVVSSELAWFISKDHRGSSESLKLLSSYEDWAKSKGCKFITMVDIDTLESLEGFYKKKGYTLTEKTYVKENLDGRI